MPRKHKSLSIHPKYKSFKLALDCPITLEKNTFALNKDNPQLRISAYATKYEINSHGFSFKPNAFAQVIREFYAKRDNNPSTPLPMLFSHDPQKQIGVWDAIWNDGLGLRASGVINTEVAFVREELMPLIKEKQLNGLSIRITAMEDRVDRASDGTMVVNEVAELEEISLTSMPASYNSRILTTDSPEESTEEVAESTEEATEKVAESTEEELSNVEHYNELSSIIDKYARQKELLDMQDKLTMKIGRAL